MPELIRIGTLELRFLCDKHETRGSLDLMEMTVPPEGQMPVAHYHRDWDESVYGLEGTITFTVDSTAQDIGPGGSLFIPRGVVHGFDNRSGAPARCLAALIAKGPPDETVVKRIMLRHGLVPSRQIAGAGRREAAEQGRRRTV
jgi:quercetin dioxygenase-like cupin family protein